MSLKKLTTPSIQTEPGIFFVKLRRGIQVFYLSSATRSEVSTGWSEWRHCSFPVDATDGHRSAENTNLTTPASRRWQNHDFRNWAGRKSLVTGPSELVDTGGDFKILNLEICKPLCFRQRYDLDDCHE
jgi:hypothetical protein